MVDFTVYRQELIRKIFLSKFDGLHENMVALKVVSCDDKHM